ncbi:hypothetical protein [Zoogloea sp. LCSB751]|uniref:hypothetical protein n=1 Tax=Zoogloea sp. LCSB751 TaxID=1965277 RepID=UPI0011160989|nr:hypothetical protein [Zoogloea sp. LCSB751]
METTPPRLVISSGSHTSFAHRILWESSQRHLALAQAHPDDGWMLHLSAGLLAAAAFEAYLNYVGEEALPHVWEEERKYFNTPPYRGTDGKLLRIAEEIDWELPPKGKKPYSGVRSLQAIRDKMVHGRTQRTNFRSKHKAGTLPDFPTTWLQDETPPKRIRGYINDVELLSVQLHEALKQSEFMFVIFGSHPYAGMLGGGTFSVAESS